MKVVISETAALDRVLELEEKLRVAEGKIERLTKLDNLTGLPNWSTTKVYLEIYLAERRFPVGLLCVDFDSFKIFNLTYGYLLGDLLLSQFGEKIGDCVPPECGVFGRFNGESFLAVVPDATPERMQALVNHIFAMTGELTVELPNTPQVKADLTVSIGGVLWDSEDEMTPYALLQQADLALRQAKRSGRGQYVLHQMMRAPGIGNDGRPEEMLLRLAVDTRGALERGEFEPFYQPLYSIRDNVPVSAEALVRWRHPIYGVLTPDRFLPLFESSGLIVKLDLYMFECSCRNIRHWIESDLPVVPIYCNFSRFHFLSGGFAKRLYEITEKYHVSSRDLGIEITENVLVEDAQPIIEQMRALLQYGFSVAMDDFGSGYSSFGMLQELPVNVIKLDRVFFQRDLKDFKNTSIICAIMAMVKALGMTVVCEGIETEQQIAFLKGVGCDVVQGFYYARPMERAKFEALLQAGHGGKALERERTDSIRSFVEKVFTTYFVEQDFERFSACGSEPIEWRDVLCDRPLHRFNEVKAHFEKNILGGDFSIIYRSITPHQADRFIPVSGEAILVDEGTQPPFCRNFYFAINCTRNGQKLMFSKFNMDLIRADSYVNLFRARDEIIIGGSIPPLDERLLLDPYYSMLPLGIIRYELSGDMVITYMNGAMFDMIGYTPEQFWGEMGGNLRQLVHRDDLNLIYQNSLRMIEGEEVPPFVYRFIRRDGRISTVLYHQCTVEAADQRPLIQSMYISLDKLPGNMQTDQNR